MTKIQKSIADIAALGNSPIDDGMRERVLKAVNDAIGDEDSRTLTPRMRKTLDILLVALGEAFGKHPSAAQLFEEAVTIAKIKLSKCDASTAGEQTLIKGGSSGNRVGEFEAFQSAGSMQVRTLSRRYSSSRSP